MLVMVGVASAQTFMDYVSAMKGDTAVIKDYVEMNSTPDALVNAINRDSLDNATVPAGRVYQLKKGGYYWLSQTINSPWTRTLRIEGPSLGPLVKLGATDQLPIICGFVNGSTVFNGGMLLIRNVVSLKNLMALPAAGDGSQGWAFMDFGQPNTALKMDNVLMEHNRWIMAESNNYAGNSLYFTNCYFVNMSGEPCRRNGGVYDNVSNPTDTISIENCTHVMAQGSMYKFRNFPIAKGFFNHNTFVDCVGSIFETLGYQVNFTVTNNLFVNSNAQGYQPGEDVGEADGDRLATGIVNVDTLPSNITVAPADRKILVDRNGVYWDSRLDNIVTFLNAHSVIGSDDKVFRFWRAQNILMNDRTKGLFDDNTNYPKLTEGNWIQAGDPSFTSPTNLMTTGVDKIVEFADSAASNSNTFALAKWRTAGNLADAAHPENWIYPDWPVPVDLSYSNTTYLTGALSGLPVGDLNWFPTQKASWNAASEHAALLTALNNGTVPTSGVAPIKGVPTSFEVSQNYPNPFNPTTMISFTLPHAGNVSLRVYNVLGQEVATLVNGFKQAQTYNVEFNASHLASGVYFYTVTFDNHSVSKKMVLMK
jgi:hypothetical protein